MRRVCNIAFLLSMGQVACAPRTPVDTSKLQRQLEEIAQRDEQNQKQIDDLNNRLFMLEEKVDNAKVALGAGSPPARLPVIRIRPGQTEEEEGPQSGSAAENGIEEREREEEEMVASSVVESPSVRFEGQAKGIGPRPALRLYGSSSSMGGSNELTVGPDPAAIQEKLPIAPLPHRDVAAKLASAKDPLREYEQAIGKYKAGQLAAASEAFRGFIRRNAKHAFTDNALYWLGECSYDLKDYRGALNTFRKVVEGYPKGNKAPDALFKMAYCYMRLREKGNARTVLAKVMDQYPQSRVARLASQTLEELRQ